jgi:hypothetical protein
MNKKIRSITSYIALAAMLIGSIPTDVFANSQAPVDSGVRLISNDASTGYSITTEWNAPKLLVNNIGLGPGDQPNQAPVGYEINIENMVSGTKETPVNVAPKAPEEPQKTRYSEKIVKALEDGFLYKFSVTPYHNHTVVTSTGTTTVRAPLDTLTVAEDKAFFLSEIHVEGTGEGNSMTLVWDNPSDLITGYKINYNKIVIDTKTQEAVQGSVTIYTSDPDLTKVTDSARGITRYKYTITNKNVITSANMYNVKIEPIFNGGNNVAPKDATYYELTKKGNPVTLTENGKKVPVTVKDKGIDNSGKYDCVVTTDLPLDIQEIDSENIKLIWTGLDTATVTGTEKMEILQSIDPEFKSYTIVGTLYGEGAKIGSWIVKKPENTVYYKLVVTFKAGTDGKVRPPMYSTVEQYNPSMIPFAPNKPNILDVKPVKEASNYKLDLTWDAFIRQPYTPAEVLATENGDKVTYVDKDIYYDIWLSDSISGLYDGKITPILEDLTPTEAKSVTYVDSKKNSIIAYNTLLSEYSKKTDVGYTKDNLMPNKLYYIKIVAKKTFNSVDYVSQPEYRLIFFNDSGNIFTPPMMSKPPLKVKLDEKQKEMIGKEAVTIEWKKSWWELYNSAKDKWESKFDLVGASLVYDTAVKGDGILIKKEQDIKDKILTTVSTAVYRPVVLDDGVKYEYKAVPYKDIEQFAKDNYAGAIPEERQKIYDEYMKKVVLPKETPTSSVFTNIANPTVDTADAQKNTLYTTLAGLTANTEYVILFRAYRTLEDKTILKSDPAYLTVTTLPEDKVIVEIPTVPNLTLQAKDDVSITTKWHDDGFKYELSLSEKPLEDPATGTIIDSAEIEKNGQKIISDTTMGTVTDSVYYKITGLFPSTQYYIWLRAKSDTVKEPSAWSSPLQVTTDALAKPAPPDGLGVASKESLLYVNDADKTKYIPVDYSYLIVEWLKDANDTSAAVKSATGKDVAASVIGAPEIKATMLTMFSSLIANKPYYVRVATRVVVEKGSDKTDATKTYSYIVQLADNEAFEDYVQIEVPKEFSLKDGGTFRTQISDFSKVIKIITAPTGSEYDGDVDPDLYPLPEQDYELIYDSKTQTLTYRLRSNQKDEKGMQDNRVDQRVISKLVQKGLYVYNIDVSQYSNQVIANRVVEIPYSLLEAFKERKIDVAVKADNMTLTLNPDYLNLSQAQQAIGNGDTSKFKLTVSQGMNGLAAMNTTNLYQYISQAQQLRMEIQTPKTTLPIYYTNKPIGIALKLNNRYDMVDKNIAAYMYDEQSGSWQRTDSQYDNQSAQLKFNSNKVTAYTAVAINAPLSTDSSEAFKAVSNKINVTDMRAYSKDQNISVNQLTNFLYSVATNKKDVELNKMVTAAQKATLSKAGLSVSGNATDAVARQEAIDLAVRLYEIKTGSPVNTSGKDNYVSDLYSVSEDYRSNILKAQQIGFINGEARPYDSITLDEVSNMINIILEDAM